jgi:hypothetical protein
MSHRATLPLRQEIESTGQNVLYLTEWPLTSSETCNSQVNVTPPVDFSSYQAQGF